MIHDAEIGDVVAVHGITESWCATIVGLDRAHSTLILKAADAYSPEEYKELRGEARDVLEAVILQETATAIEQKYPDVFETLGKV